MKKTVASLFSLLVLSNTIMADSITLYKKCAACHGTKGEKSALKKSKIINTMTKDEIIAAIKGYQDGSYGGAAKGMMKAQVSNLSQSDIQAIAELIGK